MSVLPIEKALRLWPFLPSTIRRHWSRSTRNMMRVYNN